MNRTNQCKYIFLKNLWEIFLWFWFFRGWFLLAHPVSYLDDQIWLATIIPVACNQPITRNVSYLAHHQVPQETPSHQSSPTVPQTDAPRPKPVRTPPWWAGQHQPRRTTLGWPRHKPALIHRGLVSPLARPRWRIRSPTGLAIVRCALLMSLLLRVSWKNCTMFPRKSIVLCLGKNWIYWWGLRISKFAVILWNYNPAP